MRTNVKMVISGNIIELYRYERELVYGEGSFVRVGVGDDNDLSEEVKKKKQIESRKQSFNRARVKVRRLLNSNVEVWTDHNGSYYIPQFISITFKENIQDVVKANYEFTKFMQRLNYWATGSKKATLQYVAVIEFQKRGAIHYHMVIFNLPEDKCDQKKFISLWGLGTQIDIKDIDNVDDVGRYVCKYMTKDSDDERLIGEKCYFPSRGLKKPLTLIKEDDVAFFLSHLKEGESCYEKDFDSEYQGKVNMKIFNLAEAGSLDRAGMEAILAMKWPHIVE